MEPSEFEDYLKQITVGVERLKVENSMLRAENLRLHNLIETALKENRPLGWDEVEGRNV